MELNNGHSKSKRKARFAFRNGSTYTDGVDMTSVAGHLACRVPILQFSVRTLKIKNRNLFGTYGMRPVLRVHFNSRYRDSLRLQFEIK